MAVADKQVDVELVVGDSDDTVASDFFFGFIFFSSIQTEFRLVAIIVLFTLLLLSTRLRNMMTINSDHQYISSSRSRFLEFFLVKEGYHWLSLPLDRVRLKIT